MSFESDPRQPTPPASPYEYGPYDSNVYGEPPHQDPAGGWQGQYVPMTSDVRPDDRMWATVSHAGSFLAAWFALGLLCPLIVLLVRSERPFVREHAYESLNFQLNALIIAVVGGFVGVVFGFLTLGLGLILVVPLALAYVVWYCVLVVMAAAAANRGQSFRYPAIMRLINP